MIRFAVSLFAVALSVSPVSADNYDGSNAEVDVLTGWHTAQGTHTAALRVRLAPGWKTYWRAPGEAGLPPVFDWSGSGNLEAITLQWPVPEVITSGGMTTLGFHDELILPIEAVPADAGADIQLEGALAMGICQEICMPVQLTISATLPAQARETDPRIKLALDRLPNTAAEAGVVSAKCALEPIADGVRVTAKIDMPPMGHKEFTVIEAARPDIWVSEAVSRRAQNMLTVTADLVPPEAQPFNLDPASLRLTVLADGRAVDIEGCDRAR